ncbi:MAG: DedA family protein [Ktedonobacteraceae bacterium]|nr:DedA family protein [Ktedonobacteraceae bacterium]
MHVLMNVVMHTNPFWLYLIVILLLAFESSGIPIVNSTLLLFTGALAASGRFNIATLGFVAIIGSIGGACCAYALGARGGRRAMLRMALFFRLDRHKIQLFEHWFQRYGIWMVFASRIIPYIRPFTCFPAGFSHTNFTRFFISVTLGSMIWCTTMLYLGWSLGRRWGLALRLIQTYTIPVLVVLALLVVLYWISMRFLKRQIAARLRRIVAGEV